MPRARQQHTPQRAVRGAPPPAAATATGREGERPSEERSLPAAAASHRHVADARGTLDAVDAFERLHAWRLPAAPRSPRAALGGQAERDSDVLHKLHALQAGARALQAERDNLRSLVEACDRERVVCASESREILLAVSGRAEQMLGALASLDDRERDRAALESVLSENGLRDKAQRLQGSLKAARAEQGMLRDRLALADRHAADIEAETRRCKARLMTTKKEKEYLTADNTVQERRAKHAGLALADERLRHARLLEEIRLLTSAVEETKIVEDYERRKVDELRLRLQRERSNQTGRTAHGEGALAAGGSGDADGAGLVAAGGVPAAAAGCWGAAKREDAGRAVGPRGGWGGENSSCSLFPSSRLLGEDTLYVEHTNVDLACAGLNGLGHS